MRLLNLVSFAHDWIHNYLEVCFLKIGIVNDWMSSVGGTSVQVCLQGNELVNLGHEVHIFSLGEVNEHLNIQKCIYHRAGKPIKNMMQREMSTLELINYIIDYNRKYRLDVLIAHYPCAMMACAINYAVNRIPFISVFHGTEHQLFILDQFQYYAVSLGIPLSSMLISISEDYKKQIISSFPQYKDNIKVIHDALFPETIDTNQVASMNTKLSGNGEFFVFGYIGRLYQQKGIYELLPAFKSVTAKYKCKLLLVGEGAVQCWVKEYIKENNLSDRVILSKFVNHKTVYTYLSAIDALILPSHHEGLGTIAIESLYCGTPVLGSRVGGIPEVVIDRYNGLLFEPNNIDEISKAMIEILENSDLFINIKKNSKSSSDRFLVNRIARELESVCRFTISSNHNNYYKEISRLRTYYNEKEDLW